MQELEFVAQARRHGVRLDCATAIDLECFSKIFIFSNSSQVLADGVVQAKTDQHGCFFLLFGKAINVNFCLIVACTKLAEQGELRIQGQAGGAAA